MKAHLSILLLSFYVLVTAGMVVHKHYSGDSPESSTLFYSNTCTCGGEEPSDCCSGENAVIQFDTDGLTMDFSTDQPPFQAVMVASSADAPYVHVDRLVFLPQLYIPPAWCPDIRISQQRYNL
jgi:hypothetical protein